MANAIKDEHIVVQETFFSPDLHRHRVFTMLMENEQVIYESQNVYIKLNTSFLFM